MFRAVTVKLNNEAQPVLSFFIDKDDLNDFLLYISGYCNVIYKKPLTIEYNDELIDDIPTGNKINALMLFI